MVGLGDLPGGAFSSLVFSCTADGSIAVGTGTTASGDTAFIWDAANGMRRLQDVLVTDYGLDLSGWTLTSAFGVSDDGFVIAGNGINPSGDPEGYVAILTFDCSDGIDNDGDGLTDFPSDPGCANASDTSEQDAGLPCDDGIDNDGDNLIDLQDPVCLVPTWPTENAQCQDGFDNDGDGHIDFDGGESIYGVPIFPADPGCLFFWDTRETPGLCGLGPELALILPLLGWARRRRPRPQK